MIHILFTGLGSMGTRHLNLLRELNQSFDFSAFRSNGNTEDFPDVTSFTNLDDALDAGPDVAFITNPTNLHVETAMRCARAGCDLFIEKPLSHELDGVEQLVSLVDERELVTMMGCQLRYDPVLNHVKRILDDEFPSVYSFRIVSGSALPEWRPGRDYRETYSASRARGGGAVLDLIHELDYATWLFGGVTVERAKCARVSHLCIDAEDIAEIILRSRSGAIGSVHLDFFRPVPQRKFEIVGENEVLTGDLIEGTLERIGPETTDYWTFDYDRDDLHRAQLKDFLVHCKSREIPENDVHEGRKVLELAMKARNEDDC